MKADTVSNTAEYQASNKQAHKVVKRIFGRILQTHTTLESCRKSLNRAAFQLLRSSKSNFFHRKSSRISATLRRMFRKYLFWLTLISLPYMSFANKMAPGVSEWICHAEHESGCKNFPSRHVFEKIGVATPKNGVFSHFWKIVELNHDVLQVSLILETKYCSWMI